MTIKKSVTDLTKSLRIKRVRGETHFGEYKEESSVSEPIRVSVVLYCHQNRPVRKGERNWCRSTIRSG